MIKKLSRQREISKILGKIAGISDTETYMDQYRTGIAEPGDLLFIITYYKNDIIKDSVKDVERIDKILSWMMGLWKPWAGFERDDSDDWHVGIYLICRKRKAHNRKNIWMIHSIKNKGVNLQHITPRNFTNKDTKTMSRVEVLRCEGISEKQRKIIIDFANSKIGLEFDTARMRNAILTYAFGMPNVFYNQNKFQCQQLAIAAYAAAGIHFPHPYKSFPKFNIGRYLGHPLGHPKDRVDPRFPYLMDHHIYRDPRFVLKAAAYQDPTTNEIILQTENLKKYSWNEELREKYIKKGYLDP